MYFLNLRLGITPDDGAEEAFAITAKFDELPPGQELVEEQDLELPGLNPDEPLRFRVERFAPKGDDVEIWGWRWRDSSKNYHYWATSLQELYEGSRPLSIPIDAMVPHRKPCTYQILGPFAGTPGLWCESPSTTGVIDRKTQEVLPRCDNHRGMVERTETGEVVSTNQS